MFGILVYVAFRYEFSFAIGAVLAIVHDVLMTAGLFFIAGMVTGIDIASGELNAPVVAAFLTIIGFSINDTIVIFDRIREALTTGARGSFANVMNLALNQTLARTIITSGTTLLSTAMLYFFGGVVIHDFAFCLLVGVIVGTYSSIYIACAIVLWKHKGKRPELTVGDIEISPDPVSA
jgi:preprotein translocase SecF subunit